MGELIAGVAGFLLGLGVAWLGLRDRLHHRDQIAEALADLALDRLTGLPQPTQEDLTRMLAAAMQAPDGTPFAWWTLVCAAELLGRRRESDRLPHPLVGRAANSLAARRGQSRGQIADKPAIHPSS